MLNIKLFYIIQFPLASNLNSGLTLLFNEIKLSFNFHILSCFRNSTTVHGVLSSLKKKCKTNSSRWVMAASCLFLAGKVEETPKLSKDIVRTAKNLLSKEQFTAFALNPVDEMLIYEKILLQVSERTSFFIDADF